MTMTADTDADPETAPATPEPSRIAPLLGLAWDVGLPTAVYYALHAFGVPDFSALLGGTLAAGLRLAWVAARSRRITWFGALMVVVFGAGLVLALVGGDARFLLLKDSFTTGAVGLVFLASLLGTRPLTFSAYRTWAPTDAAELDAIWDTAPAVRHSFRLSSLVWSIGLVAEALLRIPLIYVLPIDVAVGASSAMQIVAFVALGSWNAVYAHRVQRRLEARDR